MTEPTPTEPSMEDILASIRRIISEDEASTVAAGAVEADDPDVLVLRERAPPEPTAAIFEPPPAPPEAEPEPEPEVGLTTAKGSEPELKSDPEPEHTPAPTATAVVAEAAHEPPALVAPETAKGAAASFQKLSFVVDSAAPPSRMSLTPHSPTIEDVTRELLRPMLKAWLDDNLEELVRARVDEEVERISRRRVR